jgi:hypothetical protein
MLADSESDIESVDLEATISVPHKDAATCLIID